MERQLKERLIGAAVLFAIAVILVPEMFSGPKPRSTTPEPTARNDAASEASTDQMKTWRVNLQDAPVIASSSSLSVAKAEAAPVEQPAPEPRGEEAGSFSSMASPLTSSMASSVSSSETSVARSSASSRSASSSSISTQSSSSVASVATASSKSASSKAASSKSASSIASSSKSSASSVATSARSSAASTPAAGGGKWQVQVGSFGAETKARQIAAQLKGQGQVASVSTVKAGGKTLYRVRVAAGTSREAAQVTLKKLAATYPGASLVAPDK